MSEGNVRKFAPKPDSLARTIRQLAASSIHVRFSVHATERMDERGITTLDALWVLRNGSISGEITPGNGTGEWRCKVVARKKGGRTIGVVTIVMKESRLFVKTVEWEDR